MAQFSFNDYKERSAQRAATRSENSSFTKVGFFKLKNSGDVAYVRINYKSTDEFMFATYHQLGANVKYMKVLCLDKDCPLCSAAETDTSISKAKDRIFIPMLVAYKNSDGSITEPAPVIWDAPAAGRTDYAAILVSKLEDFGPLTDHVFKVTRMGTGLDTTYAVDYIPNYDKETIVPKDFSAFANFKIDKHSYWIKTANEINAFLATGQFPAVEQHQAEGAQTAQTAQPVQPQVAAQPQPVVTPQPQPQVQPQPIQQEPAPAAQPVNKFSGFSF